jgi:glycosyltransferase involved in cell wall biosynthesis
MFLPPKPHAAAKSWPTVMQLTPNLDIGGSQETVRTVAQYLPRTGCPTVVCSFRDGPLHPEIERLGIPVEILPDRRYSILMLPMFVLEMVRRRRDLLRLIAKHDVNVVQTQGLGSLDFVAMTLGIRKPLKVWWTIQNADFMVRAEHLPRYRWLLGPKRAAHRGLYRLGARLIEGVIAVSDETARSFCGTVGKVEDHVTVVCNAVDVERYPASVDRDEIRASLGFGSDDHVMTMVGTFKRQKGHHELIDAAASVLPAFQDLHLLLVGDGQLGHEIRGLVASVGLSDRIHFLGSRRDVPELLAASDSFVLPSLWEGLPVALVEAMASGLPVVATAVSGTSQVMVDGATGWLVPPRDPEALAAAMTTLLSNPETAATMAAAGRARVLSSFSALGQADQLACLFRGGQRRHWKQSGRSAMSQRDPVTVVFLMGAAHSGSTVLDIALGNHPNIESVGELYKLPRSGWVRDHNRRCACGATIDECPYWIQVYEGWTERVGYDCLAAYIALQNRFEWTRRSWPRLLFESRNGSRSFTEYVKLTAAMYEAIRDVSGRKVIVDSSKRPIRGYALLLNDRIDTRLIHLVRDGRGVAWSHLKPRTRDVEAGIPKDFPPTPVLQTSLRWVRINLESEWVRKRASRSVRTTYESFVEHPDAVLGRISTLLDDDLSVVVTALSEGRPLHVGHNAGGNQLRMSEVVVLNRDTEWTSKLPPEEQRTFWYAAGWLARRYGYDRATTR